MWRWIKVLATCGYLGITQYFNSLKYFLWYLNSRWFCVQRCCWLLTWLITHGTQGSNCIYARKLVACRPLHRVKQERPWGCDWVYLAPPRGALQPERTRFTAWSRLGLHRVIKCPGLYRQAPPRGALQLTRDLNPRPHRVGHFNWARAPPRGAHQPGISSPRGDGRIWRVLYDLHRRLNAGCLGDKRDEQRIKHLYNKSTHIVTKIE